MISGVKFFIAVFFISQQRMTDVRHMSANLMCAPCVKQDFTERSVGFFPDNLVFGDDLFVFLKRTVGNVDRVGLFVFVMKGGESGMRRVRNAFDNTQVVFFDSSHAAPRHFLRR